jgi:voltage-dependent potassium channel beta subunit
MIYRTLGKSGLKVSAISLGSWMTYGQSVDQDTTTECIKAAYDAGINFFDGAEAYGAGAAEVAMGKAFQSLGLARDTMILSAKVSPNAGAGPAVTQKGLNRKHLIECLDATLQRYGTEYVDLYFCHRPDPATPLQEVVITMNHLIQQGKIFYWGTSEFSPADLLEMHAIAREYKLIGPQMEQTGYNMLGRHRVDGQLLPLYEKYGIGTTVYSPLAGGILTGKYNDGIPEDSRFGGDSADWLKKQLTEDKIQKTRKLTAIAEELGTTMADLALAWVLSNPNVSTAIIGSTKPRQIEENVKACDTLDKLTDDVLPRIEEILDNRPK